MATVIYTTLALIAFAGNSVLCRMALGDNTIDAASFTALRLFSGIVVLFVILSFTKKPTSSTASKGSWKSGLYLFVYAICFSFAYITLDTATGALILFGAVQLTMMTLSFLAGHRFNKLEWTGLLVAFGGFIYLVLPKVSTPSLYGFILMSLSGIAWGLYTLAGKQSKNPLSDTSYNFLRTFPLIAVSVMLSFSFIDISAEGAILAVLSGGIASGVGYTIWYRALRDLSAIQAAVLQLLVPVIAALGGVLIVNESITVRLVIASLLILGGIFITIQGKMKVAKQA
ncbi:MAG: DMT family transporter [Pseudomonadota bacterium]